MNLSSGRRCIHGQSVSGFKYRVSRRNRDYFGKIRLILSAFARFCNIAKIRVPIFGYDSKFTFLTYQHIIIADGQMPRLRSKRFSREVLVEVLNGLCVSHGST
jgi:hypothetical protein